MNWFLRLFRRAAGPVHSFETTIAGVGHEGRDNVILDLRRGDRVNLVREPQNQFDKRAVAVFDGEGRKLGYIPAQVAKNLGSDVKLRRVVATVNRTIRATKRFPFPNVVISIEIYRQ